MIFNSRIPIYWLFILIEADQTETINDILTKNETVLEVKNEASDDLPKETGLMLFLSYKKVT